jgi:hypothetical protein
MATSLDLLILPLARAAGREQTSVPGLHVAVPPRRPARFRDRDHLALHLVLEGNAPLPTEQVDAILENLAKTYYNTPGTVTTAQRACAEALNQFLLDRNLRNASTGGQSLGYLTQVVLREDRLSIAQSGLTHTFLAKESGTEHIHDLSLSGNGLGLSRTTPIRYSQINLQANDVAVIGLNPPASWTQGMLAEIRGQGTESVRRRLLSQAGAELNAFLLHAQPGSGQMRLLRPVRTAPPPLAATSPSPVTSTEIFPESSPAAAEINLAPKISRTAPDQVIPEPIRQEAPTHSMPHPPERATPAVTKLPGNETTRAAQPAWLNQLGGALGKGARTIASGAGNFARLILPDTSLFTIPSSTMIFVAVLVPLVVVAVGATVYFQRGRAAQYNVYFNQAQEAAADAGVQTDPQELRGAWEDTLALIDQAEFYQSTDESRGLRAQAQSVVDDLDVIERIDFKPAIVGGLPEEATILRLIAEEDDLFLLNAGDGIALHAVFTSEGYRLDPTFQCGPGPTDGLIIGALVDIAPAPEESNLRNSLYGIDANGNLLNCAPGESPVATSLQPPDINWGTPRAITIYGSNLYVLDPQTNAVWVYREMNFAQPPRLFFDEQIPAMGDVIDLAVNQGDLYLLHADGHLTTCVSSELATSPTRCQEPAIFTDPREGRSSGALIEGAIYSEIKFSPPPEPSFYLLEPGTRSIHHFSVRLTYDRQYRSQEGLPDQPATAFAIDKGNRIAFLALGNQIYYAAMP